ncbi:hypothetical protein L2W58_04550 [Dethiosulfovibrio sp. F2B]|uniref:hypothetical protein n=1 Tax=Dethiosulfovibrio faecalis TaxID=2720018 RepID=UPI001F3D9915|nr:hypothetical protein [Dethiosulfovibrio faecalis]MCF4151064.1 hypothetical protein [Dethiosulfovibrio faecalis]
MNDIREMDRLLRSFGLNVRSTRELLDKGESEKVLAMLAKEESRIALKKLELEDLREAIAAMARKSANDGDDGELSDDDMELLSAAGEERIVKP